VNSCVNHALKRAFESYAAEGPVALPPDHGERIGDGDYRAIGNEFLGLLVKLAELKPHHTILDLGCGLGRVSQPLVHYIDDDGEYLGLDINFENVEWCRNNIASQRDNFHFRHIDVNHPLYNPGGSCLLEHCVLPVTDESVDVVAMISVFTHLPGPAAQRAFSEVYRVLKPGGRLFATFFLAEREMQPSADDRLRLNFSYTEGDAVFFLPGDDHYSAVAMDRAWLDEVATDLLGFSCLEAQAGHWSEPEPDLNKPYQDIRLFGK